MNLDTVWTIDAFEQHPWLHWFAGAMFLLLLVGMTLAQVALRMRRPRRTGRHLPSARKSRPYTPGTSATTLSFIPGFGRTQTLPAYDPQQTAVLERIR